MQIWDTAGQEKYRSIAKIYYKDAKIAILVYDVTDKLTFEVMQSWANEVRNTASAEIILAVVGNKLDLLGDDDPN
jgi:small GTP-binding protein